MFELTDGQINKATEWWADRVAAPKFDGLNDAERKDPANESYQMAEVLATVLVGSSSRSSPRLARRSLMASRHSSIGVVRLMINMLCPCSRSQLARLKSPDWRNPS